MPVKECSLGGKPGFKWGDQGHCYTYTANDEASKSRAKNQAEEQGRAIHANQGKAKGKKNG